MLEYPHYARCERPTMTQSATSDSIPLPEETSAPKPLRQMHLCIVGMGLMGGSLGLALRQQRRVARVTGVVRRAEAGKQAEALGAVDEATTDLATAAAAADMVILATPIRTLLRQLPLVAEAARPGTIIMDLGSTKSMILAAMAALPSHVQPIGGHPMCGREMAGLDAALPGLYTGAVFVLSPLPRTSQSTLARALELVEALDARPVILEPQRHDRIAATISHLPYLVAAALVETARRQAAQDPTTWTLAASGFRDTSRLGASDVTMMLDILLTNSAAVQDLTESYIDVLQRIVVALRQGDEAALRAMLQPVAAQRQKMVFARPFTPPENQQGTEP